MSGGEDVAFRVADRLRVDGPWDVFGARFRRYEVHLNGREVEMTRGPIILEGFGLRLLRPRGGTIGTGFQATTDLSDEGLHDAVGEAERVAQRSSFPARSIDLPSRSGSSASVEIRDAGLWEHPMRSIEDHIAALQTALESEPGVVSTFGSVRVTLAETSIANSAGVRAAYPHTNVEFEVAVKSVGGPEGAPDGEYWVNESGRRLETARLRADVTDWARFARDVRRAVPSPTGELPVALPPDVVASILPVVLGYRFTGGARLREMAPEPGSALGAPDLSVRDDGRFPWGTGSSPVDDEGSPQRSRILLDHGVVGELMYDALHAAAFELPSSSNAVRDVGHGFHDWRRFLYPPHGTSTTMVVEPGTGGSTQELGEAAGDGVWVQQLGWAVPDPMSGAFGGEIRIGYRIRNGKLAEPVRGGTVGGVVFAPVGEPSMLANLAAIGSKPLLVGEVSTPPLLVKNLTVAGAGT